MEIVIRIENDDKIRKQKLIRLMDNPLVEERIENVIYEFLIDNDIKESEVMVAIK
jgi:hypothetical protein